MASVLERIHNGRYRITSDLLLAVLAIFFPPFPVLVKRGISLDLLLNVVLLCLGGLPGVIHSWYIIVKYKDDGIPVVSDMLPFSGTGPTGLRHEYQQISESNPTFEQSADLESGHAPSTSQQQQQYKQPTPVHHQQQQYQRPGPSAAGSSNEPPPYDASSRLDSPQIPGDNKIQYGQQF